MKTFFTSTDKENGQQSAYLVIVGSLFAFISGFLEIDLGGFSVFMDLMFAFGAFGVIMSFTPLMGDEVPENWKYGTPAVASIITIGNLAGVMNPEFNTSPFNFFWAFTMIGFFAVSEGVVGQVWRYMLLIAGLFGLFFTGADMFFNYELPDSLAPLFLGGFVTFILGFGVGPLLAWNKK